MAWLASAGSQIWPFSTGGKDEKQVRVREAEEQAKQPVTWWRTVAGTTA